MIIPDFFYVKGKKTLLFRKEGDSYITFDPGCLDFFKLNFIGAEIMYGISIGMPLQKIVAFFVENYHISECIAERDILSFIESCPYAVHIKELLKELEIYIEK